jgi:hypothetical protein
MSDIKLIVSATDKATPVLKRINKQVDRFESKSARGTRAASAMGGAMKAAGAALVAIGFAKVVSGIVTTSAKFESLRASLKTVTGSLDGARVAMSQIEKFTATTPFQLDEVANSFIILKRMGIDTTAESLKAFGNIAAANGKSFEQLSEAVADAMTGEFERLKEFGIKVKQENGKFIASMGSTQLSVSNSAEELVNSLKSLGEEGGAYASGLADQAATMGGKFSNLQDNLASFAKGIGEGGLNTALKEVLDTFNGLFEGSGQLATKIGAGLGAAILTLVDRFKLIVSTGKAIFGGLSDMVVDLLGNIKQNFANLPEMLSMGGVVQKFNSAFVTAGNIVKKITNFMINTFRAFYEQAFSIITKLPDIFSEVFQGIGRLAIDFGSRIVNQFRSIGKAMKMAIQAPFTDVTFADALMEASKNAFENFSLGDSFDMPDEVFLSKEDINRIYGTDNIALAKEFIIGASKEVLDSFSRLKINISAFKPGAGFNQFMEEYNRLLAEGKEEQEAVEQALANHSDALVVNTNNQNKNNQSGSKKLTLLQRTKKAYDDLIKVVTKTTDQDIINKDLQPMLNKAYADGTLNLEQYSNALKNINSNYAPLEVQTHRTIDTIKQGFAGMAGSITDTFYNMFAGVTSVFDGLRSIAGMVFQMVAKAVIQSMIVKPLMMAMGIPMFAQGGLAAGGKPAIVGENGPELIVPKSNTRVFSNAQTNGMMNGGGGGEAPTVNFNINAVSTRDGIEFLLDNKNTITAVIQDAYQTRGASGPLG